MKDTSVQVLSLGPKFAVEPRKTAPELLSMTRCIGKAAPETEDVRCVSECVVVLCRRKPGANQQPVRQVEQFSRDSSLSVLPADKEGGFVVLTEGMRYDVGSAFSKGRRANQDAVVVSRLRAAGAILVAMTNVPEQLLWFDCENTLDGATRNPYDTRRVPGGSSVDIRRSDVGYSSSHFHRVANDLSHA
ncbi:hypothetical protein HPB52_022952 [Rhipicephalus sanguineus]|uniref:Amidase domain-containing protein n=1 Tax=Rhipicephalus sanguineus TaxID=34632 RepID=A0A9D4PRR4_RHISA|nr:hypothetical protein HPB52_022952 [Rhipicephalus sanguineus]